MTLRYPEFGKRLKEMCELIVTSSPKKKIHKRAINLLEAGNRVTGKIGLRNLIFLRIAVGQDNSGKCYVPYNCSRLFIELFA